MAAIAKSGLAPVDERLHRGLRVTGANVEVLEADAERSRLDWLGDIGSRDLCHSRAGGDQRQQN